MFSLQNSRVISGNTPVAAVLATGVLPCLKSLPKNGVNLRQQGCCHPVVRPMATPSPLYKRGGVVGGLFLRRCGGVIRLMRTSQPNISLPLHLSKYAPAIIVQGVDR
jgi:hypothetical protein